MTAHLLLAAHCVPAVSHCQWGEPWNNGPGLIVVVAVFWAIGAAIGGGGKPKGGKK